MDQEVLHKETLSSATTVASNRSSAPNRSRAPIVHMDRNQDMAAATRTTGLLKDDHLERLNDSQHDPNRDYDAMVGMGS